MPQRGYAVNSTSEKSKALSAIHPLNRELRKASRLWRSLEVPEIHGSKALDEKELKRGTND